MPPAAAKAPATIVKRGRDEAGDTSTTPGNLKGKSRKILYVITSLASGDWNAFGAKKWEYLQAANDQGADIQCLWFVKSYDTKGPLGNYPNNHGEYNGTYITQDDATTGKRNLVKLNDIAAWDTLQIKKLVTDHHEVGNTHLVIGTHGTGDYFWLDEYTEDGGVTFRQGGDSIPIRRIVSQSFAGYNFLSTVLDCCMMGEVYTMKHFNEITNFVGCGEGFMWSEDVDLDASMFSNATAIAMSNPDVNEYDALVLAGEHFMAASTESDPNDFGIFFTPGADALLNYITGNPVYNKILADTSALCLESVVFSKYDFYTCPTDVDRFDAQYLLDVWQIALDFPEDTKLVSLFRGLLWWHQGPAKWSPTYNFQLSGMSITCAHTLPTKKSQAAIAAATEKKDTSRGKKKK